MRAKLFRNKVSCVNDFENGSIMYTCEPNSSEMLIIVKSRWWLYGFGLFFLFFIKKILKHTGKTLTFLPINLHCVQVKGHAP